MTVDKFRIGHLNVRSLFTGFDEFKALLIQHDFDLCFLSETWLSVGDSSALFTVPGYQLFRKDRTDRGGGVAFYSKRNITPEIINFDFHINGILECMAFKIKIRNKKYAFVVFYRPPNTNFNTFVPDFDNILSNLYPEFDGTFCLGDFNVNLMNPDNPLNNVFENYNFSQIINEPTRVTANSASLLDAIFVSDTSLICESGVIPADFISDHQMIYCTLNLKKDKVEPKIVRYRCFKHFNNNIFQQDLHSLPFDNIIYEPDIDRKVELLSEYILLLFDIHAPVREARVTKPKAPWMSNNLKIFMRQRDSAFHRYKRTKHIEDWNHYKYLRNFTLSQVRKEKKAYLVSLQKESDPKRAWSCLKDFNIKPTTRFSIPQSLSNVNDISAFFSPFFQNVSDCSSKIDFYNNNRFNRSLAFSFKLAEAADVNRILHNIKTDACGVDGISSSMLKYCSPFIDEYLVHVVNCCIEAEYFPDLWKQSIGRPLAKTSNPTSFNDLRIISILPAISKVLEKILYDQMYKFYTEYKIIPDFQCGFRKKFSTAVALINVLDDILQATDKQLMTALVLLDFSKAFDSINHELTVSKLKFYGFCTASCNLINSFLTHRYQKIASDGVFSDQVPVLSGVPQGSILGPLLFLIYTADILKSIDNCRIQAYADDTQMYFCFDAKDWFNCQNVIDRELSEFTQLCTAHNLQLNAGKSYLMFFGNKSKIDVLKQTLNITVNNVKLPVVRSARNLGVFLDTDLRFREHIKRVIQKAYISLKILYSNRHVLNFKFRKLLCESLVLSNFNYCDFVYGWCLDSECKHRIQKVQNACTRFIFGIRKYDHVSPSFRELNWLNMDSRRLLHFCCFLHKIMNDSESPSSIKNRLIFRRDVHSLNIRYPGKLAMPRHRSAVFQRSFSYNAVRCYNSLPESLFSLNGHSFKVKYRQYLLSLQNQM